MTSDYSHIYSFLSSAIIFYYFCPDLKWFHVQSSPPCSSNLYPPISFFLFAPRLEYHPSKSSFLLSHHCFLFYSLFHDNVTSKYDRAMSLAFCGNETQHAEVVSFLKDIVTVFFKNVPCFNWGGSIVFVNTLQSIKFSQIPSFLHDQLDTSMNTIDNIVTSTILLIVLILLSYNMPVSLTRPFSLVILLVWMRNQGSTLWRKQLIFYDQILIGFQRITNSLR